MTATGDTSGLKSDKRFCVEHGSCFFKVPLTETAQEQSERGEIN